jgi:acyl-[acyl-carrier-protein] desaturase
VLRKWRIFERNDFSAESEPLREDLAALVVELEASIDKFEESKARKLERDARRAEKAGKKVLASSSTQ